MKKKLVKIKVLTLCFILILIMFVMCLNIFYYDENIRNFGECITGNCYNGKGIIIFKRTCIRGGGYCYYLYPNGTKYEGHFKNSYPNGEGKIFFNDGRHYFGTFQDGKFHGYGELTYPNGKKEIGLFELGKLKNRNTQSIKKVIN